MSWREKNWLLDVDKVRLLVDTKAPDSAKLDTILNKALLLKGLDQQEVAALLNVDAPEAIQKILDAAKIVKERIYGRRMVLFAPLYTGNICTNNCVYCAFRKDNRNIKRSFLSMDQIEAETKALLREGHKRVLLICGETERNGIEYLSEAIDRCYSVREGRDFVRRINIEVAPMEADDFAKLKAKKIGTYVCFQETYDPILYKEYHPVGKKANYEYRLNVMHRAMEGGIDDVGIGVLFGLSDYRFEVLSLFEHAAQLERAYGCGPHTISVPRIEYAEGVPFTEHIPHKVSDKDFKKIVAIIRLAVPYTGIILSTRESAQMRNDLFRYGVSQVSGGSKTNPGAYADSSGDSGSQFSMGDLRTLDQVIEALIDGGYIPSFCTGCYRNGRVGHDFMDLAKPGLIQQYCMPNGLFTFQEYLEDFASDQTKAKGEKLVDKIIAETKEEKLKDTMKENIEKIKKGTRDIYL